MRLVLRRDLDFICIFIDAIKSELLTLTFQSDIVRVSALIKLSFFYYKTNVYKIYNLSHHCHTKLTVPLATIYLLPARQNV